MKSIFILLFLLVTNIYVLAQNYTVQGELTTIEDNTPIPNATIKVKGTGYNTTSNINGKFTITVPDSLQQKGILLVQYKRYKLVQYRLNGRTSVSIQLPKINTQDEIIVTSSYNQKRKEEVVGSISTVSSKELQTYRPIESFDKMLEGLVAGVQVETNTELGTPVKINIRGQNALTPVRTSNSTALTTSSQPLYVIDGVPIVEQRRGDEPIAFLNNEQLLNPIAGINPDDIESISVLKDAAAASIYGANASNGVIIITTKKGKPGKTKLSLGYSSGINTPINRIKWLNGQQYQMLLKELYINEGRDPAAAELLAGPTDVNTDWFNLVNRRGSFNNYDVDFSGGNEYSQYRISASYLKQQSIQKGNDYEAFYIRMRLDNQLHKKVRMGISLAPTITKKNALDIYGIVPLIPNVPAYDFDGSYYEPSRLGVPNPLAVLAQNTSYHEGGSINGNINVTYTALKNLSFTSNFGTNALLNKLNVYESGKNATGRTKNGFAQIYDRFNFNWINFNQASWSPKIKKGQQLDITAGMELRSEYTKLLRGTGSGFSYYRLNELSSAASQTAASSKQVSTAVAVYGQAQYNLESKYFFNVSGRNDAASIFGDDVNSTTNAAVGAGWSIYKEKWMQNSKVLSNLHLRVSYGTTGNSRIGSYEAKGLYSLSTSSYNGLVGANPTSLPNPDLTWEKKNNTNLGIDIGLLGKYNITIDLYQNIIKNAISLIDIPPQNGFSTVLANVADMRNRGADVSINAKHTIGKVQWNSTLNMGFNKNIILRVNNNSSIYSTNENATAVKAGNSTSAIWGFEFVGIDPATGVELYYDGAKNIVPVTLLNNSITNATNLGDRLPKLQGGFINAITYKDFALTINIIYNVGGYRLINYENERYGRNLDNRNQSVNLLNRWQRPGDITTGPRLSRTTRFVSNSSRYLYNDTYVKLSNVSLSYTLPKRYSTKLIGARINVFANATNLVYWYQSKSPKDANGLAEYKFNFPEAQSFTWGLKANF